MYYNIFKTPIHHIINLNYVWDPHKVKVDDFNVIFSSYILQSQFVPSRRFPLALPIVIDYTKYDF